MLHAGPSASSEKWESGRLSKYSALTTCPRNHAVASVHSRLDEHDASSGILICNRGTRATILLPRHIETKKIPRLESSTDAEGEWNCPQEQLSANPNEAQVQAKRWTETKMGSTFAAVARSDSWSVGP